MKHKCKRPKCLYEWDSENPNPKACPRCKSYKWDEEVKP
jgi:predicted Zn-ribbon and HTH transcriptional regulator